MLEVVVGFVEIERCKAWYLKRIKPFTSASKKGMYTEGERERTRGRQRKSETEKKADRQRQTDRQTGRETDRQTDKEREKQKHVSQQCSFDQSMARYNIGKPKPKLVGFHIAVCLRVLGIHQESGEDERGTLCVL